MNPASRKKDLKRIIVLGGAGSMGRITLRDLVETVPPREPWEFVIADASYERANELQKKIQAETKKKESASRLKSLALDLRDTADCTRKIGSAFAIINSTTHHLNLQAMEVALATRAHYVDLGGLFHTTRRQLELDSRFKAAGRIALLGVGAAPGITNLLARLGADDLDAVAEIHTRVASIDQTRYEPRPALAVAYSVQTILEEFSNPPAFFTKGRFTFVDPMSGATPMKFPSPVGTQKPMHTLHSEVATLPLSYADKGIRECSFKIAFDPEFTDRIRFLRDIGMASHEKIRLADGTNVAPIEVINRVIMSLPAPKAKGRLQQHEVVRAVVKGMRDGKKVTWINDLVTQGMPAWGIGLDIDTGSPPSIAVQLIAAGWVEGVGAFAPEQAIPPREFFAELAKRRMKVTRRRVSGWSLKT